MKPKQTPEVLLLEAGRTVPKDRIADRLWGDRLPQRVGGTIESYVSLLRRLLVMEPGLGRRLIETDRGGGRLRLRTGPTLSRSREREDVSPGGDELVG